MYDTKILNGLVRLASSLPVGSPARASLMAHVKVADMGFDLWARVQILGGAFKVPSAQLTRGRPLAVLQDLAGRLPPEARAEWSDNRTNYKFYGALRKGVQQTIRDSEQADEVVGNLVAGTTLSGQDTDNLFYQLGRSKKEAILAGKFLPENAASDIFYNARRRAKDVFKKKDVLRESEGFDGGDEDEGNSLAETLSQSAPAELVTLLFDTAQGRAVLQKLDRLVDFSGADQQQFVWDALKEDLALIDSNMGLAKAYLERTGKSITPQGVGQLKNKVLARLARTLADNPELLGDVEMLKELSSLRRASKKNRLAKLLRQADLVRRAYDKGMLDEALGMVQDVDDTLHDLADILDARVNGGSLSDSFGAAADLSRWLRGPMSKELANHEKAFRAQARGKSAARYSRDPYWMTAKYPGKDKNGKPFRAGERVFYYPNGKVILTGAEAEAAARDFASHAFDEDGY